MEEREAKDSARMMQKNMEGQFSGGVYDEIKNIIKEENEQSSENRRESEDL